MPKHTITLTVEVDFPGLPQTTGSLHRVIEQAVDRRQYTLGSVVAVEAPDPLWPDMVALIATHMHPMNHPGTYDDALRHMQYCSECQSTELGQHYLAILGSHYSTELAALRDRLHAVTVATLTDHAWWWKSVEQLAATWGGLVTIRRRLRQLSFNEHGLAASERSEHGLPRAFADFEARWHSHY